jgi:hypothetical protein
MANCTRHDLSAKLAAALSSEEFPEDFAAIEKHLSSCGPCREELHALRLLDGFLRAHREELRDAVSGCPSSAALVDFAEGTVVDPEVSAHCAHCADCAEQVALIRDLQREELPHGYQMPTLAQQRFLRDTVSAQYGSAQASPISRITTFLETLRSSLSLPSLALGAVAAALLIVFLMPRGPKQESLMPLMSDVTWSSSVPSATKGPLPGEPAIPRKKVALIVVTSAKSALSAPQVHDMYDRIDVAKTLGSSYEFLTPKDLQDALGRPQEVQDLRTLADRIFSRTKPEYVLVFQIAKDESAYSLRGSLFEKKRGNEKIRIFHSGLTLDRVPSVIAAMSSELLLEAEFSGIPAPDVRVSGISPTESCRLSSARQSSEGHQRPSGSHTDSLVHG